MKRFFVSAVLVLLSTAAFAREGFVVGIGVGQAEFDLDGGNSVPPGITFDRKDTSKNVFVGYRINDFLALELGYADFGEAKLAFSPVDYYKIETESQSFALVVGLPITKRLTLLGRAGMHKWQMDGEGAFAGVIEKDSEDGSDPVFGAGLRAEFNENMAVRLQYNVFKLSEDDSDRTDIGDYDVMNIEFEYFF